MAQTKKQIKKTNKIQRLKIKAKKAGSVVLMTPKEKIKYFKNL